MSLELHLPDLPDVDISIGPQPQPRQPWHLRAGELVSTYLPLLLMLLLAIGSWWLVKNTPGQAPEAVAVAPRSEPDYVMRTFVVERFDKAGQLKLRIRGDAMRHYPDTDRIEIDAPRIRSVAEDGRQTVARAQRALANGDGSEVQLFGAAQVDSVGPQGDTVQVDGEFLHAFLATEKLRSHLPVRVRQDGNELRADSLDYDHLSGLLQLGPHMRGVLQSGTRIR
jgi:lipopolysaccharide export system protein LptC